MADAATLHTWAAAERYRRQVGGVTVGGVFVPTDADTRDILTAAVVLATQYPTYTISSWKTEAGYSTLDAPAIVAFADAVRAHVQACFVKNQYVDALIDAGAITSHAGIVAAFEDN
jgi:hypothetical protein